MFRLDIGACSGHKNIYTTFVLLTNSDIILINFVSISVFELKLKLSNVDR